MATAKKENYIDTIGNWFERLPSLPKNWCNNIVKIVPYFALILGILGILYGIDGVRQLLTSSPLSYVVGTSDYIIGLISTVIYLTSSIILLAAYPGTKARRYKGWELLFWWEVLSVIGGLISVSSWLSIILWTLVVFYLIFQIRPYYK